MLKITKKKFGKYLQYNIYKILTIINICSSTMGMYNIVFQLLTFINTKYEKKLKFLLIVNMFNISVSNM